jgi:hypothetical protein
VGEEMVAERKGREGVVSRAQRMPGVRGKGRGEGLRERRRRAHSNGTREGRQKKGRDGRGLGNWQMSKGGHT